MQPFPRGPLCIPEPIWVQMLAHAREHRPREACGLLAGKGGQVLRFYPTRNAHATPLTRYSVDPRELLQVLQSIDANGRELCAIFHSHPATQAYPSQTDLAQAHYPEALYLIVSLADPDHPVLRGFWLRGGAAAEHPVQIVP